MWAHAKFEGSGSWRRGWRARGEGVGGLFQRRGQGMASQCCKSRQCREGGREGRAGGVGL